MESDALRSVRSLFFLGFFSDCIKECLTLLSAPSSPAPLSSAASTYLYRCLALWPEGEKQAGGKGMGDINEGSTVDLQAIRLFSQFLTLKDYNTPPVPSSSAGAGPSPSPSPPSSSLIAAAASQSVESIIAKLTEFVDISPSSDVPLVLLVYCLVWERDYKRALQLLDKDRGHLEKLFLSFAIYLKINRPDLALGALKQMGDIDDDDPLTQLAAAEAHLFAAAAPPFPADKLGEATAGVGELVERFGESPLLCQLQAVGELVGKGYGGAFARAKAAREIALGRGEKSGRETLVNSMTALLQLQKGEVAAKVMGEMTNNWGKSDYFDRQRELEALFDKSKNNYKWEQ